MADKDKEPEVLSEAEQKEKQAAMEAERQAELRKEGGKRYDGGAIPKK